jgi:hypothetical protein
VQHPEHHHHHHQRQQQQQQQEPPVSGAGAPPASGGVQATQAGAKPAKGQRSIFKRLFTKCE